MNSKRSYLDSLNAGRQRRQHAPLDELHRSLAGLEARLERAAEEPQGAEPSDDDIARRMERLSSRAAERGRAFRDLARDAQTARVQEDTIASVGRIAEELKNLREEMRERMDEGLRSEFATLRNDIHQSHPADSEQVLGAQVERVINAVDRLTGIQGSDNISALRDELRDVRAAMDHLAREETVRSVDRHWDDFGRRFEALEGRFPDAGDAAAGLATRLERINEALENLPRSLPLHSIEDKVRTLAGAVEHFARQQDGAGAGTFEAIEERLDEISRAIAASTAGQPSPAIDLEPLERIEARITSLSRQIEELIEERPSDAVIGQLDALTRRVDEVAERAELPQKAVERLGKQIAAIAEKLDQGPSAADPEVIFRGLESRFADLTQAFERRQDDAKEQSLALFRDLEARLEKYNEEALATDATIVEALNMRFADLSQKLAERDDSGAMRSLEARLDDIAGRLGESERLIGAIDPNLVRGLEGQIAALAQHLARPENALPAFEEIGPRLEMIERSLADTRDAIVEAARSAAEDAIRSFPVPEGDAAAIGGLAEDLQSLEKLARNADERNTRTFEAIHDTLLKVVDRLGILESGGLLEISGTQEPEAPETEAADTPSPAAEAPEPERAAKRELAEAPSLDPDEPASPLPDKIGSDEVKAVAAGDPKRSPSEAAAAAAIAALNSDTAPDKPRRAPRKSMLGGLSRALSGRRGTAEEPEVREEPELEQAPAPEVDLDAPLDPKLANRPLEPGSGTPDLNAIMKRVRDERGSAGRTNDTEAAKSDFIAAARRAAQAAAAEAEVLKRRTEAQGAPGGFSLKKLFRANSKAIILSAGALLIAVAGLQLGKVFLGHHETSNVKVAVAPSTPKAAAGDETPAASPQATADDMSPIAPISATAGKADPASAADGQEPASEETATAAAPAGSDEPAAKTSASEASALPVDPEASEDEPRPAEATATPDASTETRMASAAPAMSHAAPAMTDASPAATASNSASAAPEETAPPVPATDGGAKEDAAAGGAAQPEISAVAPTDSPAAPVEAAPAAPSTMTAPSEAGPLPLREAADSGDPKAMFEIGSRYAEGRGVASSMATAAKWYEQAADLGFAPAEYRIGNFYEKGIGVKRDLEKAKAWYTKAAGQGNASAMHNLAVLYAMGTDGPPDNNAAVHWFEKAAELGVQDSQFNLGILAAKGVGMPQNLEESYKWFALVAKTGDKDAAAKRDEVANSLRPEELAKARAAAELWKAKPVDAAANVVDIPDAWKESESSTASIDMKQAVRNIQLILNKNGYDAGSADGIMGDKTRAAIAAFQKDNGMQATGEVNESLVDALLKKK